MTRPHGSALTKNHRPGFVRHLPRVLTFSLLLPGTWLLTLPFVSNAGWAPIEQLALLQIYVFASIALYIVGRGMSWYAGWSRFAPPLITTGAVWAVSALFVLTFLPVQRGAADSTQSSLASIWFVATATVLILVAALMAWRYWNTRLSTLPLYRRGAFLWLIVAGIFVLTNLTSAGRHAGWFAFGYNLLAFAGVVWLILTGVDRGEPRIMNLGLLLLAALLFARYIEFFWISLDPVPFFVLGAVLVAIVTAIIARVHRRAFARLTAKRVKR